MFVPSECSRRFKGVEDDDEEGDEDGDEEDEEIEDNCCMHIALTLRVVVLEWLMVPPHGCLLPRWK